MIFVKKSTGLKDEERSGKPKRPYRILFLADEEHNKYAEPQKDKDYYQDIDLVISCGDLNEKTLSRISDISHCANLYVNGNHHGVNDLPGWDNIEDKIVVHGGVRILGLGGSMKYNNGEFQYTEEEMAKRVRKIRRQIVKYKGFDILVTHAPAFGINDGKDLCHTGFKVFNQLLDEYSPKYFVHGHMHKNYGTFKRITEYKNTTIINAYKSYIIEITD